MFLRLYFSEIKPDDEIKLLVSYIMKICAPVRFVIKMHPPVKFGAVHMLKLARKTRHLTDRVC